MKRLLIVNADDCNLTGGVTRAILNGHDCGILTSTTFMVNLPIESWTIRELKKRKNLGVGIHLNVTLGQPVSKPAMVKSLIGPDGRFLHVGARSPRPEPGGETPPLQSRQLFVEYENQIRLFSKIFNRLPTHLDTHHQMHDQPDYFQALTHIAQKFKLPMRRSRLMLTKFNVSSPRKRGSIERPMDSPVKPGNDRKKYSVTQVKTTDYLFGNLTVEGYWRKDALVTILRNLPEGISEIMCHPGKVDKYLKNISSFIHGREEEYTLFSSPSLHRLTQSLGLRLTHFGVCYT